MKAETNALLEKAERALRAAEVLMASGDTEFSAGRAYYAMLHVAQALLREKGQAYRKHASVHAAYGEHFAKTGELPPKFHRWMLDAFDERLRGDYDVGPELSIEAVRARIEQAREFLRAAREHLQRPQR